MAIDIDLHFGGYNKTVTWGSGPAVTPKLVAHIDTWPCVPDQVRGYYEYKNGVFVKVGTPRALKYKVALVVESPHKDEFDVAFNPIAPLNGTSGENYNRHITKYMGKWFVNNPNVKIQDGECFEVYVMNPVQYQASLYHFLNDMISRNKSGNTTQYTSIDDNLRDKVWEFLFDACGLKTTFIDRLKKYGPDYIINCCTGGNKSQSLKSTVGTEITTNPAWSSIYQTDNHPSSWS